MPHPPSAQSLIQEKNMNTAVMNVQCWLETLGYRLSVLFASLRSTTAKPAKEEKPRVRIAGLR